MKLPIHSKFEPRTESYGLVGSDGLLFAGGFSKPDAEQICLAVNNQAEAMELIHNAWILLKRWPEKDLGSGTVKEALVLEFRSAMDNFLNRAP